MSIWSINEAGFLFFNDQLIQDKKQGTGLLQSLTVNQLGSYVIGSSHQSIEVFDQPYIFKKILYKSDKWLGVLPYDGTIEFSIEQLCADDYDRFIGATEKGIPFLMSKTAQKDFFENLSSFDDESVTFLGKKYLISPYRADDKLKPYLLNADIAYSVEKEVVQNMLPRLKLVKQRVLVLGAPEVHILFTQEGHISTNLSLADLLKKQLSDASFDLIFIGFDFHTLNLSERSLLIKKIRSLLSNKSQLLGLIDVAHPLAAPPFYGCSEWEIRELLKKQYTWNFWGRWRNLKSEGMTDAPLFFLGTKLETL